jgi:hypothetical protein
VPLTLDEQGRRNDLERGKSLVANRFRVFFYLDGESAEAFAKVENKARLVARAVEFYLTLGATLDEWKSRLESIEERLSRGPVVEPARATLDQADVDKKIDQLIEKMLS